MIYAAASPPTLPGSPFPNGSYFMIIVLLAQAAVRGLTKNSPDGIYVGVNPDKTMPLRSQCKISNRRKK